MPYHSVRLYKPIRTRASTEIGTYCVVLRRGLLDKKKCKPNEKSFAEVFNTMGQKVILRNAFTG